MGRPLLIDTRVRSLSIILDDVEFGVSRCCLGGWREESLGSLSVACREVLEDLEKTLDKYGELGSKTGSLSGRVKRSWKRLTWEPEDIRVLRSRITSNIAMLNTYLQGISSQVALATREGVDRLNRGQDDQERLTILNWLTTIEHGPQQQDLTNQREPGTGQWLLESPEYRAWRDTAGQTLFCHGIPGAGKTMTTAVVIDSLATYGGGRFPETGIAYIYFNFRRESEQQADKSLASLLKQLSRAFPALPGSVKSLYDRHREKRTAPSLRELSETLQSVAAAYSRVFIAIDALDECQTIRSSRGAFLKEMFALRAKVAVNLFVTSRVIPEITSEFNSAVWLEIRAIDDDVRRYIKGNIEQLPNFVSRSPQLQAEIEDKIAQSVQGMFLLAQLHLNSLVGKVSPKALRAALANLPAGLSAYGQAYKIAMDRIGEQGSDQKQLGMRVLSWITCASRPLTVLELRCALGVEVGEPKLDQDNLPEVEDMLSACAGLVTVDKLSDVIRLVHYTAQQYFECNRAFWFPDADNEITAVCGTYLSFAAFESGLCRTREEFGERHQSNPLYQYAARNWRHHARKATTLHPQVVTFLTSPTKVEAARQVMAVDMEYWSVSKLQ